MKTKTTFLSSTVSEKSINQPVDLSVVQHQARPAWQTGNTKFCTIW